jgi:hypothetical protein
VRNRVTEDGITFNAESVEVSRIKEDADYEGARARFDAILAGARVLLQIDVGFGDVIVPHPLRLTAMTERERFSQSESASLKTRTCG